MTEMSMCYINSSELSPDEERIMIRDIALSSQTTPKEGDTFFIITQRFVGFYFCFGLIFMFLFCFCIWVT